MNAHLASFSPATDTHELARVYVGRPLADLPTTEIHMLDLRPDLTATRHTIPARTKAWAYLTAVTLGAGLAHLAAVTS